MKSKPKKPAGKHKSHDGFHSISKDGTHNLMGGPMAKMGGGMAANMPASGPLPMPSDNDGDENGMSAAPSGYMQP